MNEFIQLCADAKRACESMASTNDFEPYFDRVLTYIKQNPDLKASFSDSFMRMLQDSSLGPWELITYCMHELRWIEIYDEARRILKAEPDFRIKQVMSFIMSSFSDTWEDRILYKYYQQM